MLAAMGLKARRRASAITMLPPDPIVDLLHADPTARLTAAVELTELAKKQKAVPTMFAVLLKRLQSEPLPEVRSQVATALGWAAHHGLADEAALPIVVQHLEDSQPKIRHDMAWIIESFAERGVASASAVPALLANLEHDDADTRAASVYALGSLTRAGAAEPSTLSFLAALESDHDENVRTAVRRVCTDAPFGSPPAG